MENQENLRQPLSMLGVIRETMNTIVRNRRSMKLITSLLILTYIQLQIATRYDLEPFQEDFSFQISFGKPINRRKDVTSRDFHAQQTTKLHILFCSYCLFWYLKIFTISSSYEAYTGNTLSIIYAFFKVSRNWKGPLLTSGFVLLLTWGIYVAYGVVFAVISFLAGRPPGDSFSVFYISALRWICSAYVASLGMMSLVVTVLENNISGLKAVNRAGDLMKGKRIQASLLMLLYYVACLLVRKSFDAMSMILEEWAFEEWTMWAIRTSLISGFMSFFEVFVLVFYTVFYHECKMEHDVEILHVHSFDKTS